MSRYILGKQLSSDLEGCNRVKLNDLPYIRETLREATYKMNARIVGETFHHFSPQGVTGVVAITESHIAIHTWPEYGCATVDIFTCGIEQNPHPANDYITERLEARNVKTEERLRSILILQT